MQPVFMEKLHRDHARLARLLEVLEAEAAEVGGGARGTHLDVLATLVDYVSEYPDAVHHPREDRVFGRLQEKPLTPQERGALRDNVSQHAQLAAATSALARDIDAMLGGGGTTAQDLSKHVREYVALQREHMRNEEELVFPLALKLFSDAEWEAIEHSEQEAHDPVFDQRLSRYESLYEYAVEET